ncbi:MAG: hypothetical protein WCX48_12080, partial [Bacteroidales bacterium]
FNCLIDTSSNIQIQLDNKADTTGTPNNTFQLENGVIVKNDSVFIGCDYVLGVRNASDTDYACIRAKNITATGTITYIDTTNLNVFDNWIFLNSDITGDPFENGGIQLVRGTQTDTRIMWDESNLKWVIGFVNNESEIITADGYQNLYNKTLLSPLLIYPSIGNFENAMHNHETNVKGGKINDDAFSIPVRPIKGGTGQDSRLWTGIARVDYGVWSASNILYTDLPFTWPIDHDLLDNVTANQHHNEIHDINSHTNILDSDNGGTGFSGYTEGQILVGNSSGNLEKGSFEDGENTVVELNDGIFTINSYAGYDTIKDDIVPLTKRTTLNFSGDGFVVVDDNPQTKVTLTPILQRFSLLFDETGILIRRYNSETGTYDFEGRSLIGDPDYIEIANADGNLGNPTITLGDNVVTTDTSQIINGFKTFTNVTLEYPEINGFLNAQHTHVDGYEGGTLNEYAIVPTSSSHWGKVLTAGQTRSHWLELVPEDDSNVTLDISTDLISETHTFGLGWTGQLSISRGGTNASS